MAKHSQPWSGNANLVTVAEGAGPVVSVNTQTGVVVLDTSDIAATTDKNYVTDAQQTTIVNFAGITTTHMTEDVQLTSSSTNIQIITGQTVVDPDPIWSLKAENSPVDGRPYRVINKGGIYPVAFKTFSGDLVSWVYTGTEKTFVYSSSEGWVHSVEGSALDAVALGENEPLLSVYVDNLGLDGNTLSVTSDVDMNITAGATKKVKINSVLNNSTLTASEIVATNSLKDVVSLPVATYPSLPELAHVKGVTSAIQTQIDTKLANTVAAVGALLAGATQTAIAGTDLVCFSDSDDSDILKTITIDDMGAVFATSFESLSNREVAHGYVSLDQYRIKTKNEDGTFISLITNVNTAARTYTFPDRSGFIADDTDLALKANLATVNTFTKAQSVTTVNLTSTTNAVAVDASLSNFFYHLLTENTTVSAPTGLVDGTSYNFLFKQDAVTARTLAFNPVFLFPDSVPPTISTTLDSFLLISCIYYSTPAVLVCVSAQNFG